MERSMEHSRALALFTVVVQKMQSLEELRAAKAALQARRAELDARLDVLVTLSRSPAYRGGIARSDYKPLCDEIEFLIHAAGNIQIQILRVESKALNC